MHDYLFYKFIIPRCLGDINFSARDEVYEYVNSTFHTVTQLGEYQSGDKTEYSEAIQAGYYSKH